VWNHFTQIAGEDGKANCKICNKSIACNDGTTSNMASHLRKHHQIDVHASGGSNNNYLAEICNKQIINKCAPPAGAGSRDSVPGGGVERGKRPLTPKILRF